jgi:hypothetical protein
MSILARRQSSRGPDRAPRPGADASVRGDGGRLSTALPPHGSGQDLVEQRRFPGCGWVAVWLAFPVAGFIG